MFSLSSAVIEALESGKSPWELLSSILNVDQPEIETRFPGPAESVWRVIFRIASIAERSLQGPPPAPIEDICKVIELIDKAKNIVVILGAGGSVGLDFRSPGGLYDCIARDGVLEDPCQVFDYEYFETDPSLFWKYAHIIFPSKDPEHSISHYFLEKIEQNGKLLRVYTQNVDTLERGIPDSKLCYVHGSWRSCRCMSCMKTISIEELRPSVEEGSVPMCKECGGTVRPGIVFFGQPTNLDDKEVIEDAKTADLLLVIGTSLRVAPIADVPRFMSRVPSILINRAPVTCPFNAHLLGECDDIVRMIESQLGWRDESCPFPVFLPPNNFVFESSNELGTKIVDAARNNFLVTSVSVDIRDLI